MQVEESGSFRKHIAKNVSHNPVIPKVFCGHEVEDGLTLKKKTGETPTESGGTGGDGDRCSQHIIS